MSSGVLSWSSEWESDPNDVFLSVGAAAHLAGVSVDTIRRWCANGRLPFRQGGPNNHRRIRRSDLLKLLSGEASEPPVRGRGGRKRLPDLLDEWIDEIDGLLPWSPTAVDHPDRIARMLVAVRGYSVDGGHGGLIGRLEELARDLTSAMPNDADREDKVEVDLRDDTREGEPGNGDLEDETEPGYVQVLREAARRRDQGPPDRTS